MGFTIFVYWFIFIFGFVFDTLFLCECSNNQTIFRKISRKPISDLGQRPENKGLELNSLSMNNNICIISQLFIHFLCLKS